MKRVIAIDQEYWHRVCPQAKLNHMVLLEAIKSICNSKDSTIEKVDGWTVISLNMLINEVPCLGITSKSGMASIVHDLIEWGFLQAKMQGKKQLIQYTEQAELMDRDMATIDNSNPKPILDEKDFVNADNIEHDTLRSTFEEFISLRKKLKKPMTENAKKRMLKRLAELSGGDLDKQIQILHQSIDHCWLDVYPLKNNGNGNGNGYSKHHTYFHDVPVSDRWGDHLRN